MTDILRTDGVKIALPETKVVNRIQNIGFAYPIVAYKAVYFTVEIKFPVFKIFVVNQGYAL